MRAAVEREWRAQARARRLRRWMGGGVATLAAIAIAAFAVRQLSIAVPATPTAPPPIARLIAAHGAVTVEGAGGRLIAAVSEALAAGAMIRTDRTSRATVTLFEGGELRIDNDTVVALLDHRTIQLDHGGIYLDVGTSTPGSFTVRTPSGTVRDIGTRFEVRSDRVLRGALSIRVREGAVQLERAGRIDRAVAGSELLAHADGTVSSKPVAPFAADWAWTTAAAPPFVVENATLEAFLEWAAREGGWTMEWSDALRQRARSTVLHGAIDGMSPNEALDVVLPTCGLRPEFVKGTLRLRPAR